MNIKVFTSFSGYDSQCLALQRLSERFPDFGYELVGWSEIDKHAIKAHDALFPQWSDRNYGDISKIDWGNVPDFDLFTYSSPCQDFSNAGKQKGGYKEWWSVYYRRNNLLCVVRGLKYLHEMQQVFMDAGKYELAKKLALYFR